MKTCIKLFNYFFLGCFMWLLANVVLNAQTTTYSVQPESRYNPIAITMLSIAFIFLLMKCKDLSLQLNDKLLQRCMLGCLLFILFVQLIFAYNLRLDAYQNPSDFGMVVRTAQHIVRDGISGGDYFKLYKFQNGLLAMQVLIFKIAMLFGFDHFNLVCIAANITSIDCSIILAVLICRKLWGNQGAFCLMVFSTLFLPFYTYSAYYYSDTMSMPYGIAALYLYLKILKDPMTPNKRNVLYFFIGITCLIGFLVKGSAIVILVAILIHAFFHKMCLSKAFSIGIMLITFFVGNSLFSFAIDQMGWFTFKQEDAGEIPVTHHLMMGLNYDTYGAWNRTDVDITYKQCASKESRIKRNIEEIKHRLQTYKTEGYIKFLTRKSTWIWGEGTYWAPAKLSYPHVRNSILHQWFLSDGYYFLIYAYYSQVFQVSLLFLICVSLYSTIRKGHKADFNFVLHLCIFGTYVFFLLWEARSRYLLNLTPVFLLIGTDGLHELWKHKCNRQTKDSDQN